MFTRRLNTSFKDKQTKIFNSLSLRHEAFKTRSVDPKRIAKKKLTLPFFIRAVLYSILGLILMSFNITHALVINGIIDIENYLVLKTFYELFPVAQPLNVDDYESIASPIASDAATLAITLTHYITSTLITLFVLFFSLELLLNYALDKRKKSETLITTAMLITLGLSYFTFGIDVKTKTGKEARVSFIHYLSLNIIGEYLFKLEEAGSLDYKKIYLIPQIEFGKELSQTNIFREFSDAYLSTDFEQDEFAINISKDKNLYSIDIDMGRNNLKYNFLSNTHLVNNKIDVNYEKIEVEFVEKYFNALVAHSEKIKQKTKAFKFKNETGSYSAFDETKNYENKYTNYCSTIYDDEPVYIDTLTYNKFLDVAAMCASVEFVKSQYDNKFYKYDEFDRLKAGTNMIFGDSFSNERLTLSEMESQTHSICSDGFFACSEALTYAQSLRTLNDYDLGILTTPVREFYDLLSVLSDKSDDFITSLSFDKSLILNNGFKDNQVNGIAKVGGKGISGNYSDYILTPEDRIDIQSFESPNTDEVLNIIVGRDVKEPLRRIEVCLGSGGIIKNGIRCEEATKEVRKLGLSMIKMGIELKLFTGIASLKNSQGSDLTSIGKEAGMSKAKEITVKSVGIGAGLFLADHNFKSTPYHSTELVGALLVSNLVLKGLVGVDANPISNIANWLITTGIGLLIFVYVLLWTLLIVTFRKLLEIIVEVIYILPILLVAIVNDGVKGCYYVFRELILDLIIFTYYCMIFAVFYYLRDTTISTQANSLISNMQSITTTGSLTDIVGNIMIYFLALVASLFMLIKVINVVLSNSNKSIEGIIKSV